MKGPLTCDEWLMAYFWMTDKNDCYVVIDDLTKLVPDLILQLQPYFTSTLQDTKLKNPISVSGVGAGRAAVARCGGCNKLPCDCCLLAT